MSELKTYRPITVDVSAFKIAEIVKSKVERDGNFLLTKGREHGIFITDEVLFKYGGEVGDYLLVDNAGELSIVKPGEFESKYVELKSDA